MRRKGIASRLMGGLLNPAIQHRVPRIETFVLPKPDSLGFFCDFGFQILPSTDVVPLNEPGYQMLISLAKEINNMARAKQFEQLCANPVFSSLRNRGDGSFKMAVNLKIPPAATE